MVRLLDETTFPISRTNLAKVLNAYDIEDFDFSRITTGLINTTLLITTKKERYILRIYQYGRKKTNDIEEEIAFQDFLRANTIPVPQVVLTKAGKSFREITIEGRVWQALLMEYIEGQTNVIYTKNLLEELAQLQALMHQLGVEYAKNVSPKKTISTLHNGYAIKVMKMIKNNQLKQRFLSEVHTFDVQFPKDISYGFNHLDVDLGGNVLVKNGHIVAIIDFDDVVYSPVVVCLGYTLWHILYETRSWKDVERYLSYYQKKGLLSEKEKALLLPVMRFRNYMLGCLYIELEKDEAFERVFALQQDIDKRSTVALQ